MRNYSVVEHIIDKQIQLFDIKKYWPNYSVSILKDGVIHVVGIFERNYFKHDYTFSIYYHPLNGIVKCRITTPIITRNKFIHINNDNSLCLYHYRDYSIYKRFLIGSEIIPWTIDWIYSYEEFLVNGNVWKGKEAAHG